MAPRVQSSDMHGCSAATRMKPINTGCYTAQVPNRTHSTASHPPPPETSCGPVAAAPQCHTAASTVPK
jgi:hypothetical protein